MDVQLTVMPYFWDILPIMAICSLHFLNQGQEDGSEPIFDEDPQALWTTDSTSRFESEADICNEIALKTKIRQTRSRP